jgi:hypothetical protein
VARPSERHYGPASGKPGFSPGATARSWRASARPWPRPSKPWGCSSKRLSHRSLALSPSSSAAHRRPDERPCAELEGQTGRLAPDDVVDLEHLRLAQKLSVLRRPTTLPPLGSRAREAGRLLAGAVAQVEVARPVPAGDHDHRVLHLREAVRPSTAREDDHQPMALGETGARIPRKLSGSRRSFRSVCPSGSRAVTM